MSIYPLSALLKLSDADRLHLAQELWDSIPTDSEALVLTDEQRSELDRRLAAHRADPSSALPWESVRAELRDRFPG